MRLSDVVPRLSLRGALLPHHEASLTVGSGIPIEWVTSRGYCSVVTGDEPLLRELGFFTYSLPALLIPLYNPAGLNGTFSLRPDVQVGDRKYLNQAGAPNVLDVHPNCTSLVAETRKLIIVTEGAKKADATAAATGALVVCLSGVWNWRGFTPDGSKGLLPDFDLFHYMRLEDDGSGKQKPVSRIVCIAFDSDSVRKISVRNARWRLTGVLRSKGCDVRWIELPDDGRAKVGLDDYLLTHSVLDLHDLIKPAPEASRRPVINVSLSDYRTVVTQCWDAVLDAEEPRLFRGPAGLVQLDAGHDDAASLVTVTDERMRLIMSDSADYQKTVTVSGSPTTPPTQAPLGIAKTMIDAVDPRVEPIREIVARPFFTRDGELITQSGYVESARVYCAFHGTGLGVPLDPTSQQVDDARNLILNDLLYDFPFVDDASSAFALALMLEPFMREMIAGQYPIHLIESSAPGSGKGLLTSVCLRPGLGKWPAFFSPPADDEEWRKKITSSLIEGARAFVIDNVTHDIRSDHLASAVTTPEWVDRVLGGQMIVRGPLRWSWVLTANNPIYNDDIERRSEITRLEPAEENPSLRPASAFRHPDLMRWVEDHEIEIVVACLTLVQRWVRDGMPSGPMIKGSYESWGRVVSGLFESCGVSWTRAMNQDSTKTMSYDAEEALAFVAKWYHKCQSEAKAPGELIEYLEASEAVLFFVRDDSPRSRQVALGKWLMKKRGVVIAGLQIQRIGRKYRLFGTPSGLPPEEESSGRELSQPATKKDVKD